MNRLNTLAPWQQETRRSRVNAVWAWVAAWTVALTLGVIRFRMAMSSASRPDFEDYFLPAARAVRSGVSPYTVEGYIYSPLLAVLLAPVAFAPWVVTAWTVLLVGLAILSCWVAAHAVSPGLASAQRAGLFALASVTLMTSWALTMELWQGQVHLLILFAVTTAMLAASSARRGIAGASLAFAAAIKTWPAFLLVWLVRRPLLRRLPEWNGALAVGAIVAVLAVVVAGPRAFADIAGATARGSDQPLVAYTVWGAGKVLFTQSPLATPVLVSPMLQVLTTVVLGAWVCGLLLTILRLPGDPVLALPNVAFCTLLLLPVSHYVYLLIPLPALWWWVAQVLRSPRQWRPWVVAFALFIWWYLALRHIPPTGPDATTQTGSFALILGSTLLAATFSVAGGARLRPTGRLRDPVNEHGLRPPATVEPAQRS